MPGLLRGRGTGRYARWVTVLVAATSLFAVVAVTPASAATIVSQAAAQAVTVDLAGTTTGSPTTSATNDGTQADTPVTATPTFSFPLGLGGAVTASALAQLAQANNDGSSFACSGVLPPGGTIQVNASGTACTVSGSSGSALTLNLSDLPGVGSLLSGVSNLSVTLNAVTAFATDTSGNSATRTATFSGGEVTLTVLTTPVTAPLTISGGVNAPLLPEITDALTSEASTLLTSEPLVSAALTTLVATLTSAVAPVLTLETNYQPPANGGTYSVSALYAAVASPAATVELATAAVGQNSAPPTPTIAANGISPNVGPTPGGTPVTISGTGFAPGDTVSFGGNPGTSVSVAPGGTSLSVDSPPGSPGPVSVTVTGPGGTSNGETFTYTAGGTNPSAPTVAGITPTSGAPSGGNPVEIVGTNLCNTLAVTFGGTLATNIQVNGSCTTVTVDAPPGSGTVPVEVITPGGSAASPVNYTYIEPGYWETATDGGVFSFGGAQFYGSTGNLELNQPIVAMADTPDHHGYWLFAKDGGVFAFGDAQFYGSVPEVLKPGQTLNGPVVAAEATPDGGGYRLFASDGGVFDFGDAAFTGSLPYIHVVPNKPVVAAVSAPVGQGYLLVGGDGGVFAFGSASFNGSLGNEAASGIVSISETTAGNGYWVFGADGSVTAFGDATNFGNAQGALSAPVVFGAATTTDLGYWMFGTDGNVYARGDAANLGSLVNVPLNRPIVGGIGF